MFCAKIRLITKQRNFHWATHNRLIKTFLDIIFREDNLSNLIYQSNILIRSNELQQTYLLLYDLKHNLEFQSKNINFISLKI